VLDAKVKHKSTHTHTRTHTWTHTRAHTYTHSHTHAHTSIAHTRTHTRIHARTHTSNHTCISTYIALSFQEAHRACARAFSILHGSAPTQGSVFHNGKKTRLGPFGAGCSLAVSSSTSLRGEKVASAGSRADFAAASTSQVWVLRPDGELFCDGKRLLQDELASWPWSALKVVSPGGLAAVNGSYYLLCQDGSLFRNGVLICPANTYDSPVSVSAWRYEALSDGQIAETRTKLAGL
jgi:hypothetical protein